MARLRRMPRLPWVRRLQSLPVRRLCGLRRLCRLLHNMGRLPHLLVSQVPPHWQTQMFMAGFDKRRSGHFVCAEVSAYFLPCGYFRCAY
jgi:hypothetical protein